ncbi:MAG: tetratricopeptide (TPR) repeat protein [Myxococcota bacterium]|jgi:tetratricopeptide (TPR) repeat protein
MGDLAVTVCLNGVLVEDRVIPVHSIVRLGEAVDALVPFPGADVAVVRLGKRLALRGRTLDEGEEMDIALGATLVHLKHTHKFSPPSALSTTLDTRFLVAAVLVMVIGSWIDAAEYWIDRQPHDAALPIARLVEAFEAIQTDPTTQLGAAVRSASDGLMGALEEEPDFYQPPKADGPVHAPDDHISGTGYYVWYRAAVLDDAHQAEEAMLRYLDTPYDPSVRRVLARVAYNRDDYEAAAWHYRWLLERFPDDRDTRLRLARSEKRLGLHHAEVELYRQVIAHEPDNAEALSGLAIALLRLGRLDEAQGAVDDLLIRAPMHPYTHITQAVVSSWMGHTEDAVSALEQGFTARAQLSEEMQIELRRDIALDPAFHSLRKDWHLRAMLLRHLGAAAPRPTL